MDDVENRREWEKEGFGSSAEIQKTKRAWRLRPKKRRYDGAKQPWPQGNSITNGDKEGVANA
jgi:hypothetical protein